MLSLRDRMRLMMKPEPLRRYLSILAVIVGNMLCTSLLMLVVGIKTLGCELKTAVMRLSSKVFFISTSSEIYTLTLGCIASSITVEIRP